MSQTELILEALRKGEKLTPLNALNKFNCLRLGARIWDLQQKGYCIKREIKKLSNGKHIAEYWLEETPPGTNYKLF